MPHRIKEEIEAHAIVAEYVDRLARRLCTERCAAEGKPPCWSEYTEREDAQEWPNPHCVRLNCHRLAEIAIDELFN
jgi:hypothetical protein